MTIAGLDPELFAAASVGETPSSVQDSGGSGSWFYATLRETDSPLPRSLWEADLAQGAVAERLATSELDLSDVIVGSSFAAEDPGADPNLLRSGAGNVLSRQFFSSRTQSDATVTDAVGDILADYGLEGDVDVLRPLDVAVAVTVHVRSADDLRGRLGELQMEITGSPAQFEGVYLEIVAPSGPLAILASSSRAGVGRQWFDPASEVALGVPPHGHMAPVPG
ncbi:hypothetical protein [Nocardioides sp.]|uniref:hypothetical protein n=1 Tax=Nocardioides sp. TaxID=35761 RepID=UPI0035628662